MKKPALAMCFALCACSSGDTQQEATADEFIVDCESIDAGITVFTSDEALTSFINAEASGKVKADPCKSPVITAPAGTVSAATPPSIAFEDQNTGAACLTTPVRPRTHLRRVPRGQPGYLRVIESLLASVSGTAQAHCAAVNGTNYYFRVLPQGGTTPIYSAMLSVTSFKPDAAKWQKAMSGRNGQTVTIVIERAVFLKGDINDGPYSVQATLTVGP